MLNAVMMAIPLVVAIICVTLGRYPVTIRDIFDVLLSLVNRGQVDPKIYSIIITLRLPRIILAAGLGAGLACAGAAFQGLFGNPLATPDTLGVTSGASVGAVIALMLDQSLIGVQLFSLLSGLTAVLITVLVSRVRGKNSIVMLILSGVIISALFGAILSILKYLVDPSNKLPTIIYWLMGSLAGITYKNLLLGMPLILIGTGIIVALRWRLNILTLSEDEAKSTGINVQHTRAIIILASTMVTASCVSMCGQVGWVGLLVPHMARMLCGSDNRRLVPLCLSLGAVFMLLIDTVSRTMTASEIPISILTAIIGAPIFISLLRNTGGNWS